MSQNTPKQVIGILGGMGPHAGLDLCRKIFNETRASSDQDHVPVAMLSYSDQIPDRAPFLLGASDASPVPALVDIALAMERAGVTVAGMPCNTAHAPKIFDAMTADLEARDSKIRFLHIMDETVNHILRRYEDFSTIGVLSTTATRNLRLYTNRLEKAGLAGIAPTDEVQERVVNRSIYDPPHGIKAQSYPISRIARKSLVDAILHLKENGAEAVILGCTELPLAVHEDEIEGVPIIDPTRVLARALVRATYPERLRKRSK
jgi:aspartate racemase